MNTPMTQRARERLRRLSARLGLRSGEDLRVEGIPGPVHPRDTMYDPSAERGVEYYLRAGESAVSVLGRSLEVAGRESQELESVLDYGCGYGRVLRHLPELFPKAYFVACDLDPHAVEFCRRAFGALGLIAPPDPRDLKLPSCDLVWGGSVLTHLPETEGRVLFDALAGALEPNGLLVFSFHGAFAWEYLDTLFGGAYAGEAESIRGAIEGHGFAYRPYPETYLTLGAGSYGTAWHSPEYFRRLVGEGHPTLQEVEHRPQGWDSFHDVIAFQRVE